MSDEWLNFWVVWGQYGGAFFAIIAAACGAMAGYANIEASKRSDAKLAAANAAVGDLRGKLDSAEKQIAPRRISIDQRHSLVQELRPFAGQVFNTVSYSSDLDGQRLSEEIESVLKEAGWSLGSSKVGMAFSLPEGIAVLVNKAQAERGIRSKSEETLIKSLIDAGLMEKPILTLNDDVNESEITIRVGIKPTVTNGN
jgi:hypothetical protein